MDSSSDQAADYGQPGIAVNPARLLMLFCKQPTAAVANQTRHRRPGLDPGTATTAAGIQAAADAGLWTNLGQRNKPRTIG